MTKQNPIASPAPREVVTETNQCSTASFAQLRAATQLAIVPEMAWTLRPRWKKIKAATPPLPVPAE